MTHGIFHTSYNFWNNLYVLEMMPLVGQEQRHTNGVCFSSQHSPHSDSASIAGIGNHGICNLLVFVAKEESCRRSDGLVLLDWVKQSLASMSFGRPTMTCSKWGLDGKVRRDAGQGTVTILKKMALAVKQ